jgi:hypothetical protein
MFVILATQEHGSLKPAWANTSMRPYLEKIFTNRGLMEWLKVKALSSNPSTSKKKNPSFTPW